MKASAKKSFIDRYVFNPILSTVSTKVSKGVGKVLVRVWNKLESKTPSPLNQRSPVWRPQ